MKFEMSHPDSFQRLNPSTTYAKRMGCAQWIKEAGMKLASGNIVDWPGQTLDELADDILLMKALEISWAPNIPYLPAANTPLAKEGGPGRFLLNNKEMAILRLMMLPLRSQPSSQASTRKRVWRMRLGTSTPLPAGPISYSVIFCRTPRPMPSAPLTSAMFLGCSTVKRWRNYRV